MTYVTLGEARSVGERRFGTIAEARSQLRKYAQAPATQRYDIFLSHAKEDATVIAGVKAILEADGVSVYVYWEDGDVSVPVTKERAEHLRGRMNHCAALLYASSTASSRSTWMPWELGYMDGQTSGKVAIFPLPGAGAGSFAGQEYLSIYPKVERVSWTDGTRSLGLEVRPRQFSRLAGFVRG
jgi:hypothetical protein